MKKILVFLSCVALMLSCCVFSAAAEGITTVAVVTDWSNNGEDLTVPDDNGAFYGFQSTTTTATRVELNGGYGVKFELNDFSSASQYIHYGFPTSIRNILIDRFGEYDGIRIYVKNPGDAAMAFTPRVDFILKDTGLAASNFGCIEMMLADKDGNLLPDMTEYLNAYEILIPAEFEGWILIPTNEESYIDLAGGTLASDGNPADWINYNFNHLVMYIIAADMGEFSGEELILGNIELYKGEAAASPTEAPTEAPTAAPTEAPTAAPTEAPTAAPTEAPTAAPTEAPTAAPTEAPAAQGGCGGSVALGIMAALIPAAAVIAYKKKK